ncbi:hypothetical protein HJC23_006127 [Cyclotella cryptica]|uniref:Uncharacterized protein n=1 Tax=Cyclotella cryptica TaxID=29204 RepID=A0ABD3QJU8_9STRA
MPCCSVVEKNLLNESREGGATCVLLEAPARWGGLNRRMTILESNRVLDVDSERYYTYIL